MIKILLLLAGGAAGTLTRYGISGFSNRIMEGQFPWGTLMVNLTGALVIGLLWGFLETERISSNIRTFVFVGFLGGYTTFSSYALESLNLFKDGETRLALIYILASNLLGILLVFLGFFAGKGISTMIK